MDKMLGVMLDCSRNAVPTVDDAKRFAGILAKMGYNTVLLYTEDTYEIEGQPFFGHLRGRFSKDELKEIDSYCKSVGIELIPCIQTLAHLETMLKWESVYKEIHDCRDVLLADDDKTYELVEEMFKTLAECFTSRKVHIGMDEAEGIGLGKYLKKHGLNNRYDILNKHLYRVCDIAKKYGFEPMVWNDMFIKLAFDTEDHLAVTDASKIKTLPDMPSNVSLVYWDYYNTDYNHYVNMFEINKHFGRKIYFAGGVWTWAGFTPDNSYSIETTSAAVKACNHCGIDGMFFTMWGDDGAECSKYALLPALLYAAEVAKGNDDINAAKEKFKQLFGCDFDTFMLLDEFDAIGGKHECKRRDKPSKYLLYNDVFMGMRDFLCSESDRAYYKSLAEKLNNVTVTDEFKPMFDFYKKFADALSVKCDLGIRTRKAYLDNNKDELKAIAADYEIAAQKIDDMHKAHRARWFSENKPHGFDIQDIRLGGLIMRIRSCKDRLLQYANGEISEIPELCEPVLNEINGVDHWARIVTPNVVTHYR